MSRGIRKVLYCIGVLIPLLIVLWKSGVGENLFQLLGISAALIAIMILSFQILLAGRFRWIETAFGLDVLIKRHKTAALIALVLLICHPLLLSASSGDLSLLLSLSLPWYIWVGKAALLLLLLNIGMTLYQSKIGLTFEKWRLLHDGVGALIILCAFVHSGLTGEDIQALPLLQVLWVVIPVLFFVLFAYHRLIKPILLHQAAYQVVEVKEEAPDVFTLAFAPPPGQGIHTYFPGQFQFITLYRENLPIEEHHWTISSSPTQRSTISSTIKKLGDFTSTIGQTKVGDTAVIDGPYGHFSYLFHPEENDFVFIAGGIGITPLMSMMRHMRDTHSSLPVLLIYASERESIFGGELAAMEREQLFPLKVIHVLSRPQEGWTGERGHIDKEKIERFVGEKIATKAFYLSGPKGLVEASVAALKEMQIPKNHIHVEYFSFIN